MSFELRQDVIKLLREQLYGGATPSKLIRTIRKSHALERFENPILIHSYLEAAFLSRKSMRVNPAGTFNDDGKAKYAALNRVVLPELLVNRQHWLLKDVEIPWLGDLQILDSDQAIAGDHSKHNYGISDSGWANLSKEDQATLAMIISSCNVTSNRLQIVSKLAESLQSQVDKLQEESNASSV